jgi:nucleotide-binding universal stress UspA family protein
MTDAPKKILLAADGSPDAILAARRAAGLAKVFDSELHVVHVVPVSLPYTLAGQEAEGPSIYEEDEGRARGLLDAEVARIEETGGRVTKTHLRAGEPDKEIVALAEELGVGTIVVGGRGLGPLARMPIGSISSSVTAYAHCPVLVVRGD